MKGKLMEKIGLSFTKLGMRMSHYSPEILIVTGIVGGVTTVVLACKATMKTPKIYEKAKYSVDRIHEAQQKGKIEVANADGTELSLVDYSEKDSKKDLTKLYLRTGLDYAKIYLPAVSIGVLSVVSILAGSNILRKRNVALAAAYATIDNSFKQYRDRVIQKYGDEVDKEIRYGLKAEQITEKVVDENGKEKKVKKTIMVADGQLSDYARYYDKNTTRNWEADHNFNLMILRGQQNTANDILRTQGKMYLNEVYEMLGFKPSLAGQSVGWIYDPKLGKDNYIDFGIREVYRHSDGMCDNNPDQIRLWECDEDLNKAILLDFNVDGPISEKAIELNLIDA